MSRVESIKIMRNGDRRRMKDEILDDIVVEVHFNGRKFGTVDLFYTESNELNYFAIGFMLGKGYRISKPFVELKDGILKIHSENFEKVDIENTPPLQIRSKYTPSSIFMAMEDLLCDKIHSRTGSVHMAGLYGNDGKRIVKFVDVSRHNAFDKVVGWMIENRIPAYGKMIMTSGRVSREFILKSIFLGVELLASKASIMRTAWEVSSKKNLTLIGFLRNERMNLYTGFERIIWGDENEKST